MRRPDPIPSPPTPEVAPPAEVAPADRATPRVVPEAPGVEHTPDDDTPFVAPRDGSPLTADAQPPSPGPAPVDEAPIRVRDVWRAARARRKALRAEVRRFTQRQRRRRALWLGVLASVVVLVGAALAAAYSPLFAVERITVVGTTQLSAADVESALSGQLGTPLASVDESAVKAALVAFPLVESYSLEARPPHDLVVRIVERTPIGAVQTAAGYTVVDAAGVALLTAATAPAGEPLLEITGGTGSPAFAAAGRVMRALPDALRAQVTAVSASTADDVTLTLAGTGTQIVWGSADDSARKAVVLQSAMISRPPATVRSYDVSSATAVVIG